MKIYKGKIPRISSEITEKIIDDGDIEVAEGGKEEIKAGISAILNEYLRADYELTEKAKDIINKRELDNRQLKKIKKMLADEIKFGLDDDAFEYVINQILSWFMVTPYVEEIYSDDNVMRKKMFNIFKKHLDIDEELDREVRRRIKNIQEGTLAWEIEYHRILKMIKEKRGLT